ncbi:MAG: AAA family ATPase [Candidatus Woesearchaeota archaeon]
MITLNPNNPALSYLIDELHSGFVNGIYGNASSGKTTFCLLAAISAIEKNKKVIYIDTEKSFNIERLKQLAKNKEIIKNFEKTMELLFLLQPKDFYEQNQQILNIYKSKSSKFFILIIDSISNLYKLELNKEPKKINSIMAEQIQSLIRIARDKDKIVLITNQVTSDMQNKEFKMIGGKMIKNMCKTIIELNKMDDRKDLNEKIKATLIKNLLNEKNIGKNIYFSIKENGIYI